MSTTDSGIRGKIAPSQEQLPSSPKRSQEELLRAMEAKVIRGESILGRGEAVEYMNNVLKDLLESCYSPWETPRGLIAHHYASKEVPSNYSADRVLSILPFLLRLGYNGAFPLEKKFHLNILGQFRHRPLSTENTICLLGAVAGLLPLTGEEKRHRDELNALLDEYSTWKPRDGEFQESSSGDVFQDIRDEELITEELHAMDMAITKETINLVKLGPGTAQCTARDYAQITYSIDSHLNQWVGEMNTEEIIADIMFYDICWSIFSVMGNLAMDNGHWFLEVQQGLLRQGFSQGQIDDLSFLGETVNKAANAYSEAAPETHNSRIDHPVIVLLEKNLDHLTWEQLFNFAKLVREYNMEWALAAMEWGEAKE